MSNLMMIFSNNGGTRVS